MLQSPLAPSARYLPRLLAPGFAAQNWIESQTLAGHQNDNLGGLSLRQWVDGTASPTSLRPRWTATDHSTFIEQFGSSAQAGRKGWGCAVVDTTVSCFRVTVASPCSTDRTRPQSRADALSTNAGLGAMRRLPWHIGDAAAGISNSAPADAAFGTIKAQWWHTPTRLRSLACTAETHRPPRESRPQQRRGYRRVNARSKHRLRWAPARARATHNPWRQRLRRHLWPASISATWLESCRGHETDQPH